MIDAVLDRLTFVVGGLLVGTTLADQLGDFVTYLVSLGGAGAVAFRFVVDWRLRRHRDPRWLDGLTEDQREQAARYHSWRLWQATLLGALGGILIAVVVAILG